MRILLLANIYPTRSNPGGATFIRSRVRALTDLGVEVVPVAVWPSWTPPARLLRGVLSARDEGPPTEPFRGATAPLGLWQAHRRQLSGRAGRRWLAAVTTAVRHQVGTSAGGPVDVVHAHGMYDLAAGLVGQRVADELGVPYVVSLHGSDVHEVLPRRLELYSRVLAGACATCYVSAALRDRAHELMPAHPHAHVIPNGVDLAVFRPGPRSSEPTVLYVGNLEPVKGVDRLPAVWRTVREQEPDTRLRIVGDGSLGARLRRVLDDPAVSFLGRLGQAEVSREMAGAGVVVLPSRSEGWPSVIMESYAAGTPVVGTAVGGIPEAVSDPDLVVAPGPDLERRMAAAVVRTLRAGESARHGLERTARAHEWRRVAEQELALYRRCVDGDVSPGSAEAPPESP